MNYSMGRDAQAKQSLYKVPHFIYSSFLSSEMLLKNLAATGM